MTSPEPAGAPFQALADTSVAVPALLRFHEAHDLAPAVYYGLVGAAAAEADVPRLTLDRRASGTYAVVGARVRFLMAAPPAS